jgi:hypothetical protein
VPEFVAASRDSGEQLPLRVRRYVLRRSRRTERGERISIKGPICSLKSPIARDRGFPLQLESNNNLGFYMSVRKCTENVHSLRELKKSSPVSRRSLHSTDQKGDLSAKFCGVKLWGTETTQSGHFCTANI